MQGHMYSYIWLRYGAIELLRMDGEKGPESIAFLQGKDAYGLHEELQGLNDEQVDYLISQYDCERRRASA